MPGRKSTTWKIAISGGKHRSNAFPFRLFRQAPVHLVLCPAPQQLAAKMLLQMEAAFHKFLFIGLVLPLEQFRKFGCSSNSLPYLPQFDNPPQSRFATLRAQYLLHADRILVTERGEIAEDGTYDELMKRNGLFAKLAARQIA